MHSTPYGFLMIKTLRITSVLAVILAAVVLATVLGYLRPNSLIHPRAGTSGAKQLESILNGPGAVERFKTLYGHKVLNEGDTVPPLVRQAELFANIINPPPEEGVPTPPMDPPRKPIIPTKPPVAVSNKFEILGTSCSSNPNASYAYIRLPDNTFQWVGLGAEIGHGKIAEIRKGLIVYWNGSRNEEIPVVAPPETSSLLETGKATKDVPGLKPQTSSAPPPSGKASPFTPKTVNVAQAPTGAATPSPVPPTPLPSTQIGKEEQERLSQLGDRLKSVTGAEIVERDAAVNRAISEFKSARLVPPAIQRSENPGEPNVTAGATPDAGTGTAQDVAGESPRPRHNPFRNRLSLPRPMKK